MQNPTMRVPNAASWRPRVPEVAVDERVHDDLHLLVWQARGTSLFRAGGRELLLSADHAVWIPVGVRHSFTVHEDSVTLPMFFWTDQIATSLTDVTVLPLDEQAKLLCLALVQAHYTVVQPMVNMQRQILALLEHRTTRPSELRIPTSIPARTIAEALLFNPGDDRRIEDWAESMHTSTRALERAFRGETGLTLQQWRSACRMQAAARLLREPVSVAAVARRVGYENHSAFGRAFRAHFGTSPSRYPARA